MNTSADERSPDIALYPEEHMTHLPEWGWDLLAYWSVRPLIDLTQIPFDGIHTENLYNVADSGAPTFVFSNHLSWADHFLIMWFIIKEKPYRCSALAKEKYFKWPGVREVMRLQNVVPITNIKITFARWFHAEHKRLPTEDDFIAFMESHGSDMSHPVNVCKSEAMGRMVADTQAMLERHRVILAYPEGTRSKSGRLQATKTGIMQLPLMLKGTIVPTVVIGTDKIMGRQSKWYDFLKYFVVRGPTVQCSFGKGLAWDEVLAQIEAKFEDREDPINLKRVRSLRDEIVAGKFQAFSAEAARYERIFDEVALVVMRRINDLLPAEHRTSDGVEVKYSRAV